jgi:uncharacterized protein
MRTCLLNETFERDSFDPRLTWMHSPSSWRVDANRSRLVIEPDSETDFWQTTHYGFRRDNGHFLHCSVPDQAVVTGRFHSYPAHIYDQAGLMVRFSDTCWLKASVEFEPDHPSHLGAVVTNHGYSDWSLEDFPGAGSPHGAISYSLRVRLEGNEALVEYSAEADGPWRLIRVARLFPEPGARPECGIYACSPQAAGYRAEVEFLRISLELSSHDTEIQV